MAETLPLLTWDERYSVHVKLLDTQHMQLVETINLLINAIHSMELKEKMPGILQRLDEYSKKHFATEEMYFKKFNYKGAAAHIKKHEEFRKKLKNFEKRKNEEILGFSFKLADFLEDWLINHVTRYDKKYIECFNEHGLN